MSYAIDGKVGIDVTKVDANIATQALGATVTCNDGTYQYVKAGENITQYMAVAIDETGKAMKLTDALAATGQEVGIAQTALTYTSATVFDYGWVLKKGNGSADGTFKVLVLNACNSDTALYSSGTAGYLDDTSTAHTKILGVTITTTATTTMASNAIVAATLANPPAA